MPSNPPTTKLFSLEGKTVLVTGGTRGVGLETALAFARYGAQAILTYRWGDHDDECIKRQFVGERLPGPDFFQADVSKKDDTVELMKCLKAKYSSIDIFINNASSSSIVKSFDDYSFGDFRKSLAYSSWPLVDYAKQIHAHFGHYPSHIVAVSSTGPDHYSFGYDFVAATKSVLECMVRYLNYRLRGENVQINAVRSRAIKTRSLSDTFGSDLQQLTEGIIPEAYWIEAGEVANAIVALCSGYCNAISGHVLTVDRGTRFFDNFMDLYTRHVKGEINLKAIG